MNDSTLRAYLLGQLPEDDAAKVEEQALQDDDFFQTLRSIEDDLFDEHARNRLSGADRERFLERYSGQPQRAAFARALAARTSSGRVLLFSPYRWVAGLAAAAVLVLAVGTLVMRREAAQPGTAPAGRPSTQAVAAPSAPPVVVALALGTSRAAGSATPVTVPKDAASVDLRIRLDPADRFDRYALELRSAGDTVVWHADDARAATENGELVVHGTVPAASLDAGSYELAVRGSRAGAAPEDVGFAALEVHKTL